MTIDVEPDNVWAETHSCSMKNVEHLLAFHRLCQDYGVRPTYLVSWSVAADDACATILDTLLSHGDCEVGIHPHLWETPPIIDMDLTERATVGLDYPEDILQEKISNLVGAIRARFGPPTSHRAGRWGIDHRQAIILTHLGICVDSSVIPGIDWSSTGILDHTCAPLEPYFISDKDMFEQGSAGLLEVPCTIKPGLELWGLGKNRHIAKLINKMGCGSQWLRASPSSNVRKLIQTCQWAAQYLGCLNLMSHSSEFMANGSPYWKTEADVEYHFSIYRKLFEWWQQHNIIPRTLSEFSAAQSLR